MKICLRQLGGVEVERCTQCNSLCIAETVRTFLFNVLTLHKNYFQVLVSASVVVCGSATLVITSFSKPLASILLSALSKCFSASKTVPICPYRARFIHMSIAAWGATTFCIFLYSYLIIPYYTTSS